MRFRVLGPLEVRSAEGALLQAARRKQRLLLALLVLQADRKVTAQELMDQLWGERPPASALSNLQSYVAQLRRLFGDQSPRLRNGDGSYRLHADDQELDHVVFERLVREGQAASAAGQWSLAAQQLTGALALWRGEAVAEGLELPEQLRPVVTRLEELRVSALEDSVEARLMLGQHQLLDAELSLLTARHPHRERLWGQLMLTRYRCGRRADALAAYRQLYRLLDGELGITPGPALRELHQRILDDDAELPPTDPPPTAQDSTGPQWTAQCQLPLDIPHFTGRADALAEVERRLLDAGSVPVVVLSGSPGVGKTTLATHVGHRLRSAFPDGQWYVRLRGAVDGHPRDPSDVLAGLLRTMGYDGAAVPDTLEERAAAYRAGLAGRRVLLVCDDALGTDQVRPLLPGTPGCAVLVASRSDLRGLAATHAARCRVLGVLEPSESQELLAYLVGPEQTDAEPAAAAELARLCAHLPLALGIAAANLAARPGSSLAAYVAELAGGDRLGRLAVQGDQRAAVRAAFDRSYAALDPAAARLFRLLGLVPGGDFTAAAADALLGGDGEAGGLLDALTTAGLIQHYTPGRYQFHDLLRLYAAEHARGDADSAEAWQRLCDWSLATTEAAVAFRYTSVVRLSHSRTGRARPFADHHEALDWLERERANLVAVIVHAAESGPYDISWLLTNRLCRYFFQRRHHAESGTAIRAGLRAARTAGDAAAEAVMHHSLGFLLRQQDDLPAALAASQRALEAFRSSGFALGEAAALINRAGVHETTGELRQARADMARSLEIYQGLDDPDVELLGDALTRMSEIHSATGELDLALEYATEAIEVYRSKGEFSDTVWPLVVRARTQHHRGRYEQAERDATEALRTFDEAKLRHHDALARNLLAQLCLTTSRTQAAGTHAAQALETARAAGDRRAQASCLITLADLHRLGRRPDQAIARLRQALELSARGGHRHEEADAHAGLARALLAAGDPAAAAEHAQTALDAARDLRLRIVECRALLPLAAARRALGDDTAAGRHHAQADRIQDETGYRPSLSGPSLSPSA